MSSQRPHGGARDLSHVTISRRHLLAMSGVVAAGGLSGCLSRVASSVTNTSASPAAVFAGDDDSVGEPHVSRLTPTVSASAGSLSGDVELEAWVTAVVMEDYNSPRSDRSAANPADSDSDDDGVDDGIDLRATALELERTLLSQTTAAADAISKRSARTGRNRLAEMGRTIDEVQATVARCSGDVCETIRENADVREGLVRRARDRVETGEWDDAAAAVDEVLDIVEGDIERLESGGNPLYEAATRGGDNPLAEGLAPPGADPLTDAEREQLVEYLSGSPMVGERFTVCLPDAEVPGGNGSLAAEVTPQRFIDYITGRAASAGDGKVYAWGARSETASGNGGGDCDDRDTGIRPGDVCTPRHLESAVSGPLQTGGGLRSARTDGEITVVNDPPRAEAGPSVLVCPVDDEAYEPSDLSEWGSESGASSETPTIVCQVTVQPPECPVPIRALLHVKRCRSDEQLVYTGGWVLDAAGLYEESVTMLTAAGETEVVDIECCFDYSADTGGDGYGDLVSRSLSGERDRRGARIESGTVSAMVEAGTLSEDGGGGVYCWGDGSRSSADAGSCGETGGADGEVVVTHCPLDAPVLHLVNAGSVSNEVKFKAGAELSKSVN